MSIAWLLAPALVAALASCGNPAGDPADAGTDAPILIRPDYGPPDPGPQDPGDPQDTPADPGQIPQDPGTRDAAVDPGVEDPGEFDPGEWDPGAEDPGTSDPGCVPNCVNKECGTNGCGGSCGTCVLPRSCIAQKCVCQPQCNGKTCGDDGCGGVCGTCPNGGPCTTDGKCESRGPCTKLNSLACADGSVSAYNGSSNSDVLDAWPSSCGSALTPGPEKVFRFQADQSGSVTFTLTGQPTWMDLYLIEGATCGTAGCTAHSHDTITLDAVQGTVYWIAVDATVNDTRWPTLAIDCSWYVATPDP
jgi:hypothetical protein